jgi:hypothetical protein
MVFQFNKQLNVGDCGEKLFLKTYQSRKVEKADGIKFDFTIDDRKTVELKTDTYSMERTPNFFMEYFGNRDTGALGGPWRALQDKVDYFVYLFLNDGVFFWFDPKTLCPFLDIEINKLQPKEIPNRTWTTVGFAVSREICNPYCLNVHYL